MKKKNVLNINPMLRYSKYAFLFPFSIFDSISWLTSSNDHLSLLLENICLQMCAFLKILFFPHPILSTDSLFFLDIKIKIILRKLINFANQGLLNSLGTQHKIFYTCTYYWTICLFPYAKHILEEEIFAYKKYPHYFFIDRWAETHFISFLSYFFQDFGINYTYEGCSEIIETPAVNKLKKSYKFYFLVVR